MSVLVVLLIAGVTATVVVPELTSARGTPVVGLHVTVGLDDATVAHDGGEELRTADLTFLIRTPGGEHRFRFEDGFADGRFGDGDEATFGLSPALNPGDRVVVLVVHEPTNSLVYEGRKLARLPAGEGGNRLVWSGAGDWDAGVGDGVVHDDVGARRATRLQLGYAADGLSAPGLVGYFPLDETGGVVVEDATGRNDGTLLDDSAASHDAYDQGVPGVFGGNAYRFSPEDIGGGGEKGAYVDLGTGTSAALADTESFTWTAWVKVAAGVGNKDAILAANFDDRTNNVLWFICQRRQGSNSCTQTNQVAASSDAYLTTHDGSFHFAGGRVVNDGRWHHVAVTLDGDTGRLVSYIDATEVGSTTISPSRRIQATDRMSIAQDYDAENYGDGLGTSDFFEGTLDEVQVYDRVLSEVELGKLRTLAGTYTSGSKAFDRNVRADDLRLTSVVADPNGGTITVVVEADTDGDGLFETSSDPIPFVSGQSDYEVDFEPTVEAATYRLSVTLSPGAPGDDPLGGPTIDRIDLERP